MNEVKLTIRECEGMGGWWVIERAEHDGREWIERTGPNSLAFRTSARFSDADVEGTGEEMLAIAAAIEKGEGVSFRRCSVEPSGDGFAFSSPRNSTYDGTTTKKCALDLARLIRERVKA